MPKKIPLTPASVAAMTPAARRKTMRKITISCALCVLFGVAVLAFGGYLAKERLGFLDRAVEVRAKVIARDLSRSTGTGGGASRTTYRPTFEFTDERGVTRVGGPITHSSAWDYAIGSTVPVWYDPDNPTDVRPRSGFVAEWLGPIVCGVVGAAFVGVSLMVLYAFRFQPGRRDVVIE